ncbi:MAG: hypothetical protein WA732_19510, partial [Pseudolabrys sp.]
MSAIEGKADIPCTCPLMTQSGKDACRPGSPSHKKGGKPGCNSLPPLSTARSETGESKANGLSS